MGGAKLKPSLRREKERKNIKLASPKVIKMTECNISGLITSYWAEKLFKFINYRKKLKKSKRESNAKSKETKSIQPRDGKKFIKNVLFLESKTGFWAF